MSACTRNITKEVVTVLEPGPIPEPGILLQARSGKVSKLGNEVSGIFKKRLEGRVFVSETGITSDEHVYPVHGGIDRAVNQYASEHYSSWRCEKRAPKPELFDYGGFGENLVGTNMNEDNVCIGDLYRVGKDVVLQVSEPRSPCYKLNLRYQWTKALKRVQRTGRVGWNYRVLQTGWIEEGDTIELIERPHPRWSLMNIKRVIQSKIVPLSLVKELCEIEVLTEMVRDYAVKRLQTTPKTYELVATKMITSRVKQLTFALRESFTIQDPEFPNFAFAQIEFGQEPSKFARSYSIVSGDQNQFSLGVALDDHSRGGSRYLHQQLRVGDKIKMSTGGSPKAVEDEDKCVKEESVNRRMVIIGGIGVTAFLPITKLWDSKSTSYEVHYAVRDPEQAAFVDQFPKNKTTLYAKTLKKRLNVSELVPEIPEDGKCRTKIYCCGPTALMDAVKKRVEELHYPSHMLHFESFGAAAGGPRGDPFEVHVSEVDTGRSEDFKVPSDKTLLQVLREAGFDMTFFCEAGGCGACKVNLCSGKVKNNGTALQEFEKSTEMLSCVDRGIGRIEIELD